MSNRRVLYWDTYQSWSDELPKKQHHITLFRGYPRGCHSSVCNCPEGAPSRYADSAIVGIGCQLHCSSDHIEEILRRNSIIKVFHSHKLEFELPLMMSREHLTEDERVEGASDIPGSLLIWLVEGGIVVPARTPSHVELSFSSAAESLLRGIYKRIGPGAGWAAITVYLVATHTPALT